LYTVGPKPLENDDFWPFLVKRPKSSVFGHFVATVYKTSFWGFGGFRGPPQKGPIFVPTVYKTSKTALLGLCVHRFVCQNGCFGAFVSTVYIFEPFSQAKTHKEWPFFKKGPFLCVFACENGSKMYTVDTKAPKQPF